MNVVKQDNTSDLVLEKKWNLQGILFTLSILLLSICIVTSIAIWNNRRFFFDEYIYNSINIDDYIKLVCTSIENKPNEKVDLSNNYPGVYYSLKINDSVKYNNLPEGIEIKEFANKDNIISLQYRNHTTGNTKVKSGSDGFPITFIGEEEVDQDLIEGTIYINNSPNYNGIFQYEIENSFNLQKLLYLDCIVFVICLLGGILLLIINFKKGLATISNHLKAIPLDIKLLMGLISIIATVFFSYEYVWRLSAFTYLRTRLILFVILVTAYFISILFTFNILYKLHIYKEKPFELKARWDNRVSKKIPTWIMIFVLLEIFYFIILAMFIQFHIFRPSDLIDNSIPVMIIHAMILLLLAIGINQIMIALRKYSRLVILEAKKMANGNLGEDISVIGNDEMAELAATINTIKYGYMEALEEQRKSERLKYELVTNISHDLRSPLTSIINYLDLSKTVDSPEKMKKYIASAQSNSQVLLLLIEDLFELSKIGSGNMKLNVKEIELLILIKQVAHEYSMIAKEEGKEIIFYSAENKIIYSCDNIKISRLFDNLIGNAVKYSLAGTRIYIDINIIDNQIMVIIRNIASYKMDFDPSELFLRFKRADSARTTEGTGLGLAIAKGIANLHDGEIILETEGDMFRAIVVFSKKKN